MTTPLHRSITGLLIGGIISALIPSSASAALTFNPHSIISDEEFFAASDMNAEDIQQFLERKGSTLASYRALDIDGGLRYASDIIAGAATRYQINPKVLLVLLQKEQSLIENQNPTQYNYDWATGFARCDSCLVSDPKVAAAKGFVTQVDRAAWRKRYYISNPHEFRFRPGEQRLVDGLPITPSNRASAALYNYTPHLRGNFSFWKLWHRYFDKSYPDGTVVQVRGTPDIWLIQNSERRRFASLGVFLSRYRTHDIISIAAADLGKYEIGLPIKYPQYSLFRSPSGATYLFADDIKYEIVSQKVFREIGYNPAEVISVSQEDIDEIPDGELIRSADAHPEGDLFQSKKTGGIYYVSQGIKHPILERAVLHANFAHRRIAKKTEAELDRYETDKPVLFRDGTLVTSSDEPGVYVISNGQKRGFVSKVAFETLGYSASRIIRSSGATLWHHPEGSTIDLGVPVDQEFSAPLQAAGIQQ